MIAFLERLTPKALKLDSKEESVERTHRLARKALGDNGGPWGKCILGSIKLQQLEVLGWSKY